MLKRILLASCAIVLPNAVYAQGGHLVQADNWTVRANWDLSSDDAYLGSRAGCFESLARIDFEAKLEPGLATGWEQTSPTTWDFAIREGVTFHDGTALDAETVANALNNRLSATVPARAFSPTAITSVEASGPMTVTITTAEELVTLPSQMASPATTILSPAAYEGGEVNPIGTCTGPFEITEVDPNQYVSMVRFDDYWGTPATLDSGQIRFIPDASTRGTMARTGEAQIVRLVPHSMVAQLQGDPGLAIAEVQAPRIAEMLINTSRPPFDDVRVREALRMAIDTTGIAAAVYEGLATPASGPFRAGEPWAPDIAPTPADLEAARALFAEAGVDPASLNITLLGYTAKTEFNDVAVIIQAMLGELGINVDLRIAEYAAIEPDMLSGNYDLALMSRGYLTDVPEPIGFLTADYGCEGSFNITQYCDPEFDALLDEAGATADEAGRYAIYAEAAQKVYDEALTVFLVNETLYDVASSAVVNYKPHPLNYYLFTPELGLQ
ncbi:ABC transporter substrate-binding protein [Pelagibacterium sp.]|uniref:ABC transporter substrate-binding protein n=1 Tax=Pelagibacterium sp. TaxID=1967288 RepID=UPI003BA9C74F